MSEGYSPAFSRNDQNHLAIGLWSLRENAGL